MKTANANFAEMNSTELRLIATSRGIKNSSKFKKDELINKLQELTEANDVLEPEVETVEEETPAAEVVTEILPQVEETPPSEEKVSNKKRSGSKMEPETDDQSEGTDRDEEEEDALPTEVTDEMYEHEDVKRATDLGLAVDDEVILILNSDIRKSDKFRKLYKKGVSIAKITKLFSTYYSFVYGALQRSGQINK